MIWDEGVEGYFNFLYGEKDYLKNAFVEAPSRRETEARIASRIDLVLETLTKYCSISNVAELKFYAEFFVFIGNYLTVTWCQNGMEYDPHVFSRYFTECMPKALIEALSRRQ